MQTDRRFASRNLLSLLAAVMLLLGSATSVLAQATPEASPTAEGAGPNIGDTIVLHDTNGDETLQLAVLDLVDPDKAVQGADRGYHWVGIQVVASNPTDADVDFSSSSISLVDEQGFVTYINYASRSDEDIQERPEFSESTVLAGGAISGWIFYQIINDATPSWVVFNDSFNTQQFAVLANLAGDSIETGTETTTYDSSGEETGTVSIDDVTTDFQKTDKSVKPARGMQTVAIQVSIAATGEVEVQPSSGSFYLVDDFGIVYYPNYYYDRTQESLDQYPDLPTDTLTAGGEASGYILFEVPKDAQVSYVTYQPDYSLFYMLAQPGPGSTVAEDVTLTPVASSDKGSTDDGGFGDETPEATADTGNTGGTETGDCVGVSDWAKATADNLTPITDLLNQSDSVEDVKPGDLRDAADQMRDAADAQADIETPEIAQASNVAIVDMLNAFADLYDEVADRLEKGDSPDDIQADFENNTDLEKVFTPFITELTTLQTSCPDSDLSGIFG
jgi:hypothetical protein